MSTKTVTIHGESFELSTPYVAGHVLTEAEAKHLNQTRLENVRNNVAKAVKEATESQDPAKIAEARSLVASYDGSYQFTLAGAGAPRVTLDPVEKEARKLAVEFVKAKLAEQGRTVKQVPPGLTEDEWKAKLESNYEKVMAQDVIQRQAKKIVAERKKGAEAASAELDLG